MSQILLVAGAGCTPNYGSLNKAAMNNSLVTALALCVARRNVVEGRKEHRDLNYGAVDMIVLQN
jgi:hypothetical protein